MFIGVYAHPSYRRPRGASTRLNLGLFLSALMRTGAIPYADVYGTHYR